MKISNQLLRARIALFFANVKKEGALKAKVYGLENIFKGFIYA